MPYAQQLEKLRLDGPAGIGPDVLVIPNDQLGGAVVQGLLAAQRRSGETGCLYASLHQCLPHGQRAVWDPEGGGNPGAYLQQGPDRQAAGQPAGTAGLLETQREQNKYGLLAKFDQIYYSWGDWPDGRLYLC